jgi:hypothetical protein
MSMRHIVPSFGVSLFFPTRYNDPAKTSVYKFAVFWWIGRMEVYNVEFLTYFLRRLSDFIES